MHIAVIGAGPAGLTVAYRLQKAGHQVDVLEASAVVDLRMCAQGSKLNYVRIKKFRSSCSRVTELRIARLLPSLATCVTSPRH